MPDDAIRAKAKAALVAKQYAIAGILIVLAMIIVVNLYVRNWMDSLSPSERNKIDQESEEDRFTY